MLLLLLCVRNWHIHFIKMIKDSEIIKWEERSSKKPRKFVAFWQQLLTLKVRASRQSVQFYLTTQTCVDSLQRILRNCRRSFWVEIQNVPQIVWPFLSCQIPLIFSKVENWFSFYYSRLTTLLRLVPKTLFWTDVLFFVQYFWLNLILDLGAFMSFTH